MVTLISVIAKAGAQVFIYNNGEKKGKLGSIKRARTVSGYWDGDLFVSPTSIWPGYDKAICINAGDIEGAVTQPADEKTLTHTFKVYSDGSIEIDGNPYP